MIVDFLTGSRARTESFMMMMDLGMLAGRSLAPQAMILSGGFADKAAHLRLTMATSTIRAMSGHP